MSDVIGPCSTLPGAVHSVPTGAACDFHPERSAVSRIQGETDSFGAELMDVCAECRDEIRKASAAGREGKCDWCGNHATDLRNRRDFEEGMYGRVYDVCGECVRKENERLREEDEDDERWWSE